MKYYRLIGEGEEPVLTVEREPGVLVDLTSIDADLTDIEDLALAASLTGLTIDEVATRLLDSGDGDTFDLDQVMTDSSEGTGGMRLDIPFEPPEVWAAGVTYKTSEMERRRESETPDVYSKVYGAERPELRSDLKEFRENSRNARTRHANLEPLGSKSLISPAFPSQRTTFPQGREEGNG